MGVGLYDLLGWGVLFPPFRVDADGYEIEVEGLHDLTLQSANECEPDYLVIPLAVSHPVLQDWWTLPPMPLSTPRMAARTARSIVLSPDIIAGLARARGVDLADVWRQAQQLCRQAGLWLPEAGAIVLSDWD